MEKCVTHANGFFKEFKLNIHLLILSQCSSEKHRQNMNI